MPAKRTIDTTSNTPGTFFLGVRLSPTQLEELTKLAEDKNLSRSAVVRELIRKAANNVAW
jgi:hypothetical protein